MNDTQQIKEFDALLNSFIDIGNQLGGVKILPGQEVLYDAEGLGKKILNHITTARFLFEGYKFKNFQPVIDFSSIIVLTRAAFENYLTFHYLFVAPNNEEEKRFRFLAWVIGGLDRTKYKPAFEEDIKKWEEEVQMIEEMRKKIEDNAFFKGLHVNNQKQVLNGKWRLPGWFELATDAGFNETFFRQQYMFLCAYAHSNRQSVLQIQQLRTLNDQREMVQGSIGILTVILAKYTYDYVQIMPTLKEKVNLNAPEYMLIRDYKQIGELLGREIKVKE